MAQFECTARWTNHRYERLSGKRRSGQACGGLREKMFSENKKLLGLGENRLFTYAYLDCCLGKTGWREERHNTDQKVDPVQQFGLGQNLAECSRMELDRSRHMAEVKK